MNLLSKLGAFLRRSDVPKNIRDEVDALPQAHIEVRVLADQILETIPGVSVTVQDPVGLKYLRANEQACAWLGVDQSRLLDKTVFEVVRDTESATLMDAADREAVRSGKHELETWCILNDGAKRRLRSTRFLFKDKFGNHQYLVNLSQDITLQHAATVRAEDLERTTHALLTGLPFPIVWLDRKQGIKGTNLSFNVFTGIKIPVSLTLLDVFPFAVAESIRTVCRLAEQTNKSMSQQITVWGMGDGSNREMVVHVCPMHDVYSQVMGTVASMYDVTDLVRSTRVSSQLSRAFDMSSDAVILTNRRQEITYVNHEWCRLFGYAKEEVLGQNPSMFSSGHHGPEFYTEMWWQVDAGKSWAGSMTDRAKDGKVIVSPTTIVPILNGNKEPLAYLCLKHTEGRTHESV